MKHPAPVNWRLFEWEPVEPKYPAGDWRNRDEPYHIGRYQDYTTRIVHYSNRVGFEYTWEISWPALASGVSRSERGGGYANETTAMLSADAWLYKRLNPTESK